MQRGQAQRPKRPAPHRRAMRRIDAGIRRDRRHRNVDALDRLLCRHHAAAHQFLDKMRHHGALALAQMAELHGERRASVAADDLRLRLERDVEALERQGTGTFQGLADPWQIPLIGVDAEPPQAPVGNALADAVDLNV